MSYQQVAYVGRVPSPSADQLDRLRGILDATDVSWFSPACNVNEVARLLVVPRKDAEGRPERGPDNKPLFDVTGRLLILDSGLNGNVVAAKLRKLSAASGLEMISHNDAPEDLADLDDERLESWVRTGVLPPPPAPIPTDDELLADLMGDDDSGHSDDDPLGLIAEEPQPGVTSEPSRQDSLVGGQRSDEPPLPDFSGGRPVVVEEVGQEQSVRTDSLPSWVANPQPAKGGEEDEEEDDADPFAVAPPPPSLLDGVKGEDVIQVVGPTVQTPELVTVDVPEPEAEPVSVPDRDPFAVTDMPDPDPFDPSETSRPKAGTNGREEVVVDRGVITTKTVAPPAAPPPYVGELPLADQANQIDQELSLEDFGPSGASSTNKLATTSQVFYVTGSHGGVGKTTLAYMIATTAALSLRKLGTEKPYVWLIETDYRNPKLEDRLGDPRNRKNMGNIAAYIQNHQKNPDRYPLDGDVIRSLIGRNAIQLDSGVRVLTSPYELASDRTHLLYSIVLCLTQVMQSRPGYVILDGETITSDNYDKLTAQLVKRSNKVVVVSDKGHRGEFNRAARILTAQHGLTKDRVHMFMNRSSTDEIRAAQVDMAPWQVSGGLPKLDGIDDGWVGDADPKDIVAIIHRIGFFLRRIGCTEFDGLFGNRRPTKPVGIFRRMINKMTAR